MLAHAIGEAVPASAAAPSPLLTYLAGEFAPAIAALWPAPHAVFLTAPAERRHLVCLALALAWIEPWVSIALFIAVEIVWFVPDRRFTRA